MFAHLVSTVGRILHLHPLRPKLHGKARLVKLDGWPSDDDVVAKLTAEASASARGLGHDMTGWTRLIAHRAASRCLRCHAMGFVYVRVSGEAPVQGEAVTMRCGRGS